MGKTSGCKQCWSTSHSRWSSKECPYYKTKNKTLVRQVQKRQKDEDDDTHLYNITSIQRTIVLPLKQVLLVYLQSPLHTDRGVYPISRIRQMLWERVDHASSKVRRLCNILALGCQRRPEHSIRFLIQERAWRTATRKLCSAVKGHSVGENWHRSLRVIVFVVSCKALVDMLYLSNAFLCEFLRWRKILFVAIFNFVIALYKDRWDATQQYTC